MTASRPFPSLSSLAKGAVSALMAALLVACSSGGGLYGPIQGDNRPHSGVDRARTMPIQGIDVARYQENIDFRQAFQSGMHFVFMKATEGKDYLDPNFRTNWVRARDERHCRYASDHRPMPQAPEQSSKAEPAEQERKANEIWPVNHAACHTGKPNPALTGPC